MSTLSSTGEQTLWPVVPQGLARCLFPSLKASPAARVRAGPQPQDRAEKVEGVSELLSFL